MSNGRQQADDAVEAAATTTRIARFEDELREAHAASDRDAIKTITKRYNAERVKRYKAD